MKNTHPRRGLSLLELLACVTILAVLVTVVAPRVSTGGGIAKERACSVNREVIEVQSALWKRSKGVWPQGDLSDVFASPEHFPEGQLRCPVDGSLYKIDDSGRVIGHNH